MVAYLDKEHRKQPTLPPPREARVQVVVQAERNQLFELIVDIDAAKVVTNQYLRGKHSYIDSDYMTQVEAACIADVQVQNEIAKLDLPPEAKVVVEAWAYATDGMNDMSERTTMVSILLAALTDDATNTRPVLVLHATPRQPRCQLLCLSSRCMRRGVGEVEGHKGLQTAVSRAREYSQ